MKFELTHALAGLAIFMAGLSIGRKKAAQTMAKTAAVVPSEAGQVADWWTYAGQWRM